MSSKDSVIDENWSFYVSITWWEILLIIAVVIFVIYLVKRKRVSSKRQVNQGE